MDLDNLEKVLEKEPKYRLKQAKEAVFFNLIKDWQEAVFLPKDLRQKLNKECQLSIKSETLISKNRDSVKARITLKDGVKIESVLMRHNDGRNTVCVSSQAGCPLGCLFCATGKMGFKRNLNYSEIIEQVIFFSRYLKKITLSESEGSIKQKIVGDPTSHNFGDPTSHNFGGGRVTNVAFMGMGDPFLNYDTVMKAVRILNDREGLNIGARSISISTVGIAEGIKKLSEEGIQVNLAISLHAPNNNLRSSLISINKKYPIEIILKEVDEYIKKTKRKVMFEYVLIKNINDSDKIAKELSLLMKKPLYFLNLILYNKTGVFKPSSTKRVEGFKKILKKMNVNFSQRYRFGQDIKAACGQFAAQ